MVGWFCFMVSLLVLRLNNYPSNGSFVHCRRELGLRSLQYISPHFLNHSLSLALTLSLASGARLLIKATGTLFFKHSFRAYSETRSTVLVAAAYLPTYVPRVLYPSLFVWERGTPDPFFKKRVQTGKRSAVPRSESAPHVYFSGLLKQVKCQTPITNADCNTK